MTSLVRPPGNLQYREGVGDPARSLDNYDEKDERGEKDEKREKDEEGVSQLILRHLQASTAASPSRTFTYF